MSYNGISVPKEGAKITSVNGKLVVPDNPIIPFIEGDSPTVEAQGRLARSHSHSVISALVASSSPSRRWFQSSRPSGRTDQS